MKRLRRFQLSIEKVVGIEIEEVDVKNSKEECSRSLVGKVYGDKRVNFVGLRNTIWVIWPTKEPFKVRELGVNLF